MGRVSLFMSWHHTKGCLPTCVKDVASLTENGTSKTLARVLANSVFPTAWVFEYAYEPETSFYLNQSALCMSYLERSFNKEGQNVQHEDIALVKCRG